MATPLDVITGKLLADATASQAAFAVPTPGTTPAPGGGRANNPGFSGVTFPNPDEVPLVPDVFDRPAPPTIFQPLDPAVPQQTAPPAQTATQGGPDPALVQQALLLQSLLQGALSQPQGLLGLLSGLGVQGPIGSPVLPGLGAGGLAGGFAGGASFAGGTPFGTALQQAFGNLMPELQAVPEIQSLFSGNIPLAGYTGGAGSSGGPGVGVFADPFHTALQALAQFIGGL
jgi:hypothetical protein